MPDLLQIVNDYFVEQIEKSRESRIVVKIPADLVKHIIKFYLSPYLNDLEVLFEKGAVKAKGVNVFPIQIKVSVESIEWKDEEKLKEEQPELAEWLLMTEFRAIIIGFSENGRVRRYLPPRPPKMHYFVYPCTTDEIRAITQSMDFLRTLSSFRNAPSDEVIAACIREAARAHQPNDFEFKVAAGKKLANLLKDDYERLEAIIRRVAP